jgi:hypothetical protein
MDLHNDLFLSNAKQWAGIYFEYLNIHCDARVCFRTLWWHNYYDVWYEYNPWINTLMWVPKMWLAVVQDRTQSIFGNYYMDLPSLPERSTPMPTS